MEKLKLNRWLVTLAAFTSSCGARTPLEQTPATAVSAVRAPRPIAPLSLGDVTLLRPMLRWELGPGTDGALVDLCRDRECSAVIESLRAVGTSVRPSRPLTPRSVVFWRLRATVGIATDSTLSPTWLFHVPARDNSNNIDTSLNAHLDVNGDGFDDVTVGAIGASPGGRIDAGTASVYHGSATGISLAPARVLEGSADHEGFGYDVASAGDLNGDGFGDLVVSGTTTRVFHGSALGISVTPSRVFEGTIVAWSVGTSVASAGDVNGDGFGDLVLSGNGTSVFHGSAMGIPTTPAQLLRAGGAVASAGDLNGDGFGDLVVGGGSLSVSVFHGSPMGVFMTPARVFVGDHFSRSGASAGDLNGDGFGDLVVGDVDGNRAFGTASVYYGGVTGIPSTPTIVLAGTTQQGKFGVSVASAGDVNGDGFGDLIVGASAAGAGARRGVGTASVYLGSADGVPPSPLRVLEGRAVGEYFGDSVATAGDVNGDGFGDLVIGSPNAESHGRLRAGRASVYHGSAMGIPVDPTRVLEGTAATDQFGNSVASAGDVNGDGFGDLLLGAAGTDVGDRIRAGTVSVFHGSATGIPMTPTRVLEGVSRSDQFGVSVAMAAPDPRHRWGRVIAIAERTTLVPIVHALNFAELGPMGPAFAGRESFSE